MYTSRHYVCDPDNDSEDRESALASWLGGSAKRTRTLLQHQMR